MDPVCEMNAKRMRNFAPCETPQKVFDIELCDGLSLGRKLEILQQALSHSWEAIAESLDVTTRTLQLWRKGKSSPPEGHGGRASYRKRLLNALKKNPQLKDVESAELTALANWIFDTSNELGAPEPRPPDEDIDTGQVVLPPENEEAPAQNPAAKQNIEPETAVSVDSIPPPSAPVEPCPGSESSFANPNSARFRKPKTQQAKSWQQALTSPFAHALMGGPGEHRQLLTRFEEIDETIRQAISNRSFDCSRIFVEAGCAHAIAGLRAIDVRVQVSSSTVLRLCQFVDAWRRTAELDQRPWWEFVLKFRARSAFAQICGQNDYWRDLVSALQSMFPNQLMENVERHLEAVRELQKATTEHVSRKGRSTGSFWEAEDEDGYLSDPRSRQSELKLRNAELKVQFFEGPWLQWAERAKV